ncbi:hypothetical protein EVAR_70779_1, partial [Eumeta japonica]
AALQYTKILAKSTALTRKVIPVLIIIILLNSKISQGLCNIHHTLAQLVHQYNLVFSSSCCCFSWIIFTGFPTTTIILSRSHTTILPGSAVAAAQNTFISCLCSSSPAVIFCSRCCTRLTVIQQFNRSTGSPVGSATARTFLTGQIQQQSFEVSGQQQSLGAYNYQPCSEQSFTSPVAAPKVDLITISQRNKSSTIALWSASIPHPSFSSCTNEAHQTVTGSSGGESGSYNYQPPAQVQHQNNEPLQQTQYVPAATPVQLAAGLDGTNGLNTGSFNYHTPAASPVTSPVSVP